MRKKAKKFAEDRGLMTDTVASKLKAGFIGNKVVYKSLKERQAEFAAMDKTGKRSAVTRMLVKYCWYLKGYEYCPTTILVLSDIHDSLLVCFRLSGRRAKWSYLTRPDE